MKKIGEIVAILDKSYVLAKASTPLKKGQSVHVFQIVKSDKPESTAGLTKIEIPKGKLIVLKEQKKGVYLLTISVRKETKTVYNNDFLLRASGLTSLLTPERITEIIPEEDTRLDESKSLNIHINPGVTIGDILKIE